MFVLKEVLLVFGVFALSVTAVRISRSPDKMEIDIPNQSLERESGEYEANMNEEATYWQGQGDKVGDRGEEGHQQLEEDRDNNQENYEAEREHYEKEQHNFNKEMNDTYQGDRDRAESQHETNQDHYAQHHNDTSNNYDMDFNQGNRTAEDLTESETGDRYGEKGTDYVNDGENKIENYDVNGDSPSISYTRT